MNFLLAIPFLFLSLASIGQKAEKINPFKSIDERVKKIQASAIDSLSKKLTTPYKKDIEKVRSIFKWITENIAYDIVGYHNTKGIYAGLFRPNISTIDSVIQKDYHDNIVNKVLNERKAVCDGYTRLFKSLCDQANIKSKIIVGNIRWATDPIGQIFDRPHAWNAVLINEKWQLLDPTWASGYVNSKITEFIKKYNEFYFLIDPAKLINDHYPDDPKWSLLNNSPSRQQFSSYPFFHQAIYTSSIVSYAPANGLIPVTISNKKIHIELVTKDTKKSMYVLEYPYQDIVPDSSLTTEVIAKKYTPTYTILGNKIYLDYELLSSNPERIDVYYNNNLILSYGVKMYR
jgi:transglutaminase/protease-like cytokinesis protein 3